MQSFVRGTIGEVALCGGTIAEVVWGRDGIARARGFLDRDGRACAGAFWDWNGLG